MQVVFKHIFLKLSVLLLITIALVSFELLTDCSISDFIFSEKISFIDSEQMEEEVEVENEIKSNKKIEGLDMDIESPLSISSYHSRYLIIKSFFIPEEISPPPELLFYF